jgi:hypothetical protein
LIWTRYAHSLSEPGTAKLPTRIFKLATSHARIHTKAIKDRVAIERKNPGIFPNTGAYGV